MGCNRIKIEIIEETNIERLVPQNGFVHLFTKKFDHLPFTVGFMENT